MSKFTNDIIYKELSYKLMGILFKVHNKLGPAYLAAANLKLGILVNFNSERLNYRRIVNPKIRLLA